jgi:hypothetical protein
MSITKDQVLISYKINLHSGAIEIEWAERTMEDGALLSYRPVCGAYELIDGDLPEHIKEEFGISMASITSSTVLSLTQTNAALRADIAEKANQIALMESAMNQ